MYDPHYRLPIRKRDLVRVWELVKHFPVRAGLFQRVAGWVRAVDGVSFTIREGETLGLVGKSGCGKTTVGRAMLRLVEPTSGSVEFDGREIFELISRTLRLVHNRRRESTFSCTTAKVTKLA